MYVLLLLVIVVFISLIVIRVKKRRAFIKEFNFSKNKAESFFIRNIK